MPWMVAVVILIVWLGVALAGSVGTLWWSVRLWRRRPELSGWARALTALAAIAAIVGSVGMLLGLVRAFGAIGGESVDPSQKARVLAESISEAMNFTATALLLWLPSVIALAILTRRRRGKTE